MQREKISQRVYYEDEKEEKEEKKSRRNKIIRI